MSHWRRINYSVSLAVLVTSLSLFFVDQGTLLFLAPGFFLELILGLVIVIDPEQILLTKDSWGGNVIIYSALCYVLSWVLTGIGKDIQERREAKIHKALNRTNKLSRLDLT